ncbi:hypothetical protein [Streptomyces sp. 891-h]|uniref:hypothetical protein n=1 Tax=unclassified Streptomyces TaxID=2593676 RepID=UPI001FAA8C2C|nr:hypothetical protein [Streptomyces sp. 891-h]UNZ15763.1 hypothetical protein HC362_00305 [Streptomyces sp. 891-h]
MRFTSPPWAPVSAVFFASGPDGTLKPGACVITVDGKEVADNQGGKSDKGCKYKVR